MWPFRKQTEQKVSKIAPLLVVGNGTAIWPSKDYETYCLEAYLKCVISFRCVDIISKSASSVPWNLFRETSEGKRETIKNHPVNKILKRANPRQSFTSVTLSNMAYLLLNGNAYMEKTGPDSGPNKGIPFELYSHRPDRIKIIPVVDGSTKGQIAGYSYTANGQNDKWLVDPVTGESNILHIKLFHPADDWYGAAITESAAREIDTYNEMSEWNKSLLQNQARPGLVFTFGGNLTDQQFDRLKRQMDLVMSGPKNAGKNLILEGDKGSSATPYGWSPSDLDYVEGGRELARRISYAYGVPPQLIGIPGDSTYSNYQEARLAFWEETVFFYLNLYREEINNWIFGKDDTQLFIDYDLDRVPALQSKRDALWNKLNATQFISTNEKREAVGYEEIDGGDDILIPANMVPLGTSPDMTEPLPTDEDTQPEDDTQDQDDTGAVDDQPEE